MDCHASPAPVTDLSLQPGTPLDSVSVEVKLICRECRTEVRAILPRGTQVGPFLCESCISALAIEKAVVTRIAARTLTRRREDYLAGKKRRQDTESKFRRRNGFTQEDWYRRVDALGWKCSVCGCELTKGIVIRRSTEDSKALDTTIPVCRSCQCKKIGSNAHKQPLS